MNNAVERAARFIWEHYSEPLSLTDIARSALLSRFHFARVFKDTTGVTPGRFLSAVRIYQAKHLLLTTSMSITDISFAVGYNSPGSFINNFTESVGASPSRFRRLIRCGGLDAPCPRQRAPRPQGSVQGTISLPDGYRDARVYVGVFNTAIVRNQPASAAIHMVTAGQPFPYYLPDVPGGTWFVHVVGVADSTDPEPWTRRVALIATRGMVSVTAGVTTYVSLVLRPQQPTDPPILLALPSLEMLPEGYAREQTPTVTAGDLGFIPESLNRR